MGKAREAMLFLNLYVVAKSRHRRLAL